MWSRYEPHPTNATTAAGRSHTLHECKINKKTIQTFDSEWPEAATMERETGLESAPRHQVWETCDPPSGGNLSLYLSASF